MPGFLEDKQIVSRFLLANKCPPRQDANRHPMHIGRRIKEVAASQQLSAVDLAQKLCCSRANVYKIFDRATIDTGQLARICRILNHDFFSELSQETHLSTNS